jgi:hypothetical protein
MVKATELRIGNLLLEQGEVSNVYMIDRGGISFYRINDIPVNKETGCTLNGGEDRFNPIPVTPEWLERCGCLKHPNTGLWTVAKIEHGENIDFFEIEQCDDFISYIIKSGDVWTIGKPFRYFHQLQNLFFALSGEELTIKETV